MQEILTKQINDGHVQLVGLKTSLEDFQHYPEDKRVGDDRNCPQVRGNFHRIVPIKLHLAEK